MGTLIALLLALFTVGTACVYAWCLIGAARGGGGGGEATRPDSYRD